MKSFQLAIMATALVLAVQAYANPINYVITFGGGGVSGEIAVDGGLATGGFLDVTSGPGPQGTFNLLAPNFGQNANGDNFAADNLVTPGGSPFITNNGLQFGGFYKGYALWSDGPTDYELFGYNYYAGEAQADRALAFGVPDVHGIATLTFVPDGGATVSLLGLGLAGCVLFSRKLKLA